MINNVKSLTDMLNYGNWVTERLTTAVNDAGLSTNERVVFVFNHVANARKIWLERVRDGAVTTIMDEHVSVKQAAEEFPSITQQWCEWLEEGGDGRLESICEYSNVRGDKFEQKVYLIVQHVVNHTTHHYHEISAMIRASGNVPPQTDYIAYVRLFAI